jgi:hypothetical protein
MGKLKYMRKNVFYAVIVLVFVLNLLLKCVKKGSGGVKHENNGN